MLSRFRKKHFSDVYPGLAGSNVLVNMDAGLVRVEDASVWDLAISLAWVRWASHWICIQDTFTLDLLKQPVRALGGAPAKL